MRFSVEIFSIYEIDNLGKSLSPSDEAGSKDAQLYFQVVRW
jgi:hypothetical protein